MTGTGWVFLICRIVGNAREYEFLYSWNGEYYAAKERAIAAGCLEAESDDFNVGYVDKGKLTWFGWMDEKHPVEDYAAVADQCGWSS